LIFYRHNQEYVVAARVRNGKEEERILDTYRNFPLITVPKVLSRTISSPVWVALCSRKYDPGVFSLQRGLP
jgi:hypothetical protein